MSVKSTKTPELISEGVKEVTRIAQEAISGVTNSVPQALYGPAPRTDEMNLDEEIKEEIIDFQEDLYGPPPSPGVDSVDPQSSNIPITVEGPEVIYGPPPKPIEGGTTAPNIPEVGDGGSTVSNIPKTFEAPEVIYGPPPKAIDEGPEGPHGTNGPITVKPPEVIYGPPPAPTESGKKRNIEDLIDEMTDPSHYN